MKVINVYDKNSDIRSYNRNIFKATEAVLKKFPKEYSNCYYKNLESLELIQVDKMTNASFLGYYDDGANAIFFIEKSAMGHELFHMASNDLENGNYAFYSKLGIENGLIEGMTEYFNTKAYNLEVPSAYQFEVFCVTMLEDIPNIFRPYFIPNYKDFISLFPNKRDIYSLLYSLNVYNDMYLNYMEEYYSGKEITTNFRELRTIINHVLASLVDIELSIEKDPFMLKEYSDKLMNYICSDKIPTLTEDIYPKCYQFADKLIDKKIRKRKI